MNASLTNFQRNRFACAMVVAAWIAAVMCAIVACNSQGADSPAPAPSQPGSPGGAPSAPASAPAAPSTPGAKPPEPAPAPAKPAEPKPAEAKPAEAKPAEPKPAEPKPAAPAPVVAKPAEPTPAPAKPPEPKAAEPKPTEAKSPAPPPPAAKPPEPVPAAAKPAEPKPAEAKPAEAKPAVSAPPGMSFALLARPAIADRLKLSDEQRAKVATLLAERRETLAKATEPDRAKVLEESEKKLAGVLSEAQQADFAKIPPEPLLRFKFRFQRWVDVLEEVARQAGLSLVLDAPPPGTLNYSDDKEYTPTEAIDLLNSVLLTKGFTLIRRDRMLVCINIEEGIPENLVPRVTLDELDYRGKFELVSVMFPLEKRAAAAVAEEIKPLMSSLGKVVPLPSTGQLLITDAAGNMRAIRALIQAMPPVAAATPAAQPSKPEPPVFAIYPLKGVDPPSVLSVMTTLYPTSKFVLDPKTDQLSVHAGPTIQASVKAILEEMTKTGQPPEKQSRLELYPIDPSRGAEILKSLEGIVPNAKLTLDARTGKLVAWATGADHDLLKKSLQTLGMAEIPEQARQFEVYRLTKADPKSTLAMLEALLPTARLAVDAPTNSLVAIASAADQKAIKSLLEQLQPEKPGPETPELRFYQLTHTPTADMATVLEGLVPKAKVTIDAVNKRLMVVAPSADHTAVKNAIDQFEKGAPPEEKNKLVNYPVTQAQRKRFQAVMTTLTAELPGIQVISDAEPGELAIWAKPEQHKVIAEILDQLKREVPAAEKYVLSVYPLTVADPASVTTVLTGMFPTLQVVLDPKTNRLLVWALPAEQDALKKTIEQLQAQVPPDKLPRFETYPLHGSEPTALTANLQTLVPNAKITTDAKAGRLVVWATGAEHDVIRAALEKLGRGTSIENTPQVETYRLARVDPTTLVPLLQTLVPDAKVSVDAATKTLIVVAVPADQQTVRGVVRQFQPEKSGYDAPELRIYPITTADPASVATTLTSTFPALQITLDSKTNRLLVSAFPTEHDAVKKTLEQIEAKVPAGQLPRFEIYPVHGADPSTLVTDLQTLVPSAKLVADAKSGRIIAWGTGADHEALKAALEKMVRGATPESAPRLEVYRLTKADPSTLTPLLQTLVPDARISIDSQTKTLIAVAVPADHLTIKTVLEQLQPQKPGPDDPQLRFYPLAQPLPATIVTVLQGLAPKAQVTLEPGGKRLTVVASPADHAIVKAAIEQIQTVAVLDEKNKLVTYPVTPGQKKRFQTVATSLASELPGMQIVSESESDQLAVWAKPSQHTVISEILEQLKLEVPAAEKYQLVAYPIKAADPQNVLTVMKALFPNAQFVLDSRTRRLIVWTLPADQEAIKAALEKIDTGTAAEGQDKLMVYPVPDIDPATAITVLQDQLPDVKLSSDPKSGAILAWARPAEHAVIARTLKELKVEPDAEHKETLVVYPLESGDATALATVLKTLVPKAQVVVESKTNNIMATAVPKDHELIRAAIEQVSKQGPAGTRPEMVVHSLPSLGSSGAAALIPTLKQIFPDATFAAGADPTKLAVWAKPADQEPIRKAIEEMAKKDPPELAHKLVIYTVERAAPGGGTGMLTILRSLFPDASAGFGSDPTRLFVWARPADHPSIKNMIDELSKKEPAENAHRLVVFTLDKHGPSGVSGVLSVLQTMFPQVIFTAGTEPDQLVAWIQPSEEKEIREALKTLAVPEDPKKARKIVVYTLESTGPGGVSGAMSVLTLMFPEGKFTAGTDPQKLVAWARPAEHERIKAAVDELAKKEPPEKARKIVVYTIRSANSTASSYTLSLLKTMFPDAQFTLGTENDQLVVWARPAEHVDIKTTIDQISLEEPPEKAHKLVIYTLETTGPAGIGGAMSILTTMFAEAKFTAGSEPDKIAVWARPADHKKIEAAVKELSSREPPEKAHQMIVYALETTGAAGATGAMSILTTMFPEAKFAAGTEPNKVVAWARPDDQKKIAAAVVELSRKEPAETARKIVVYPFKSARPRSSYYTISVLREMFPDAMFSIGAEPDKLVVWARPSEHEAIKSTVEQLSQEDPPERAFRLAAYTMESAGAAGTSGAITMLSSMFPEAQFTAGSEPGKLLAWARPDDQVKIKAAVEELGKKEPPEKAAQAAVYQLNSMMATAAIPFLTTAFPEAQFSAGAEPHALIVWARPADQKEIKAAVEKIDVEGAAQLQRTVSVYALKDGDARSLAQLLEPMSRRNVQVVTDATRQRLIVWADAKQQEQVRATVEQFQKENSKIGEPSTQVYRFQRAEPQAAQTVLAALAPAAQIALDATTHSLVVTATPDDHAKIKAAIDEMDRRDEKGQAPRLQVHRVLTADPTNLLTVLQGLFRSRSDVQLSLDEQNDAIVAVASPAQHETIQNLIDQLEKEAKADSAARLQLYPLKEADPDSTLQVLTDLMAKQGIKAKLSLDPRGNQLVVIARPEQQATIQKVLDQMQGEERELEIFTLEVVDTWTAEMAVNRLFGDSGTYYSAYGPSVDIDPTSQQLFVRATKEQLTKIRELLVKLGETGLGTVSEGDGRRSRTVPFDGDLSAALDEIQRVWPQLRTNPIHVMKPANEIPVQGRSPKQQEKPDFRIQPAAGPKPPTADLPRNEAVVPAADAGWRSARGTGEETSLKNPPPETSGWRASRPKTPQGQEKHPVVVVPGEGSVTIASDDPAALAQFEELLRALSRQRGTVGRNFSVFLLRNAKAASVSQTLQQVFRRMPTGWRSTTGSVVFVPDERLNAIVAHASRADRAAIEGLIKVLDTSEVPESLAADRMHLIPVKNTNAARIEQILQDLFKGQVEALSVEATTNSLVVMASGPLVEEITRVVNTLDEAAGSDSSRNVTIVPLKKASSDRVQKALDVILKSNAGRRRR